MVVKTDIDLSKTTELVVRANRDDHRDWLADAPVCGALLRFGIVHTGASHVVHPYDVRRPDLSGTFVLVCTGGEGQVQLEGTWRPMRAGQACLAPQHSFHAYRAVPGQFWRIAWVRYQEPAGAPPIVSARAPLLAPFDGEPLTRAIEGLHREASQMASPSAMQLWTELIQHYAAAFAEPWRTDDRLRDLWLAVASNLDAEWTLDRLAAVAGISPKQLTRLCKQALGRPPAKQVTALRLQESVRLLVTTSDKVEAIARQVGYRSLFTFSRTFKQFTGHRPSDYRRQHGRIS